MEDNLPGAKLLGIHLEGPFLNPKFKGAMPENLLKKPDINLVKKYQDRAKGNIKYITISPELLEDMDFIKELRELGIVVALGHSDATFNETVKAIYKGAESFTHLMNTMRPIHQHEIGIAGVALMADIYAEIIIDGLHLNKNTVKFIEKNKGYEKLILVTDCIMAAGLPDGKYKLGVNDVTVSDGDARLTSDGTRAGSTLTIDKAFRNFMDYTKLPIEKASRCISENHADLMGYEDRGLIKEGFKGSLTILDKDFNVKMTIIDGNIAYEVE